MNHIDIYLMAFFIRLSVIPSVCLSCLCFVFSVERSPPRLSAPKHMSIRGGRRPRVTSADEEEGLPVPHDVGVTASTTAAAPPPVERSPPRLSAPKHKSSRGGRRFRVTSADEEEGLPVPHIVGVAASTTAAAAPPAFKPTTSTASSASSVRAKSTKAQGEGANRKGASKSVISASKPAPTSAHEQGKPKNKITGVRIRLSYTPRSYTPRSYTPAYFTQSQQTQRETDTKRDRHKHIQERLLLLAY